MKQRGALIAAGGMAVNFILFLIKLYMGISSNSLSIYCDAINNLGDTVACIIALSGFVLVKKYDERHSERTQSLFGFVMNLAIALSGLYFVYSGIERFFYPLPVSYSMRYAVLLCLTIAVKLVMGLVYRAFERSEPSQMLKAMFLDSFLDCFVTLAAVMSLLLVPKFNFALDGVFSVAVGLMITVVSIRNLITESKFLINN